MYIKFALIIGSFFGKVIVGYKKENLKSNRELKNKTKKSFKNDNSKIYLGISLELLRAVWGQLR